MKSVSRGFLSSLSIHDYVCLSKKKLLKNYNKFNIEVNGNHGDR